MKNAEAILENVILALREIDMKGVDITWGGHDMPVIWWSKGSTDVHNLLKSLGREPTREEILQYHRPGFVEKLHS